MNLALPGTGPINLSLTSQSGGSELPAFLFAVLDPKAAADYLHVSEPTVIEEAEKGRLPGRKIGSDWRFLTLALADWLRAEPQPKPEAKPASSKERMLAVAGAWKDDPTVDAMMEEIHRNRKANSGKQWDEEVSHEAEQFIKQIRDSRQTAPANPVDSDPTT